MKIMKFKFAANSVFVYDGLYQELTESFNQYSSDNNLNIQLETVLFSDLNVTYAVNEYGSTIESLLLKKSKKYDIYCFDPVYNSVYAKNLDDLTLLNRYKKDVPQTWDELIETSKYILEQERNLNNTELIAYNGLFSDLNAFNSFYEFIFSFRNTPDPVFPGYDSDEAVAALNKLKELKNEISSDEIFKGGELMTFNLLMYGTGLFVRFWDSGIPLNLMFYSTVFPGKEKGINTSLVGGMNLGISKYISQKQKEAAIKVIEYMTSEEVQREIIIKKNMLYSAIAKFYDDEEICKLLSCPLVKNPQKILYSQINVNDYDAYYLQVNSILEEFLFGDRSAKDVLEEINNITKVFNFSLDLKSGLIMFIV
ncbi:periplasmic binding protein-like II, partial [Anaeromyces robustus]